MSNAKVPKASGTYGFLDVIRHPSLIFRTAESSNVPTAAEMEKGFIVSCFLRGTYEPFPRGLKQGSLTLSSGPVSWTPYFSIKRSAVPINITVLSVTSRGADERERNVKKGGKAFGIVQVPTFEVVTCTTSSGSVDFVVPAADGALVFNFFKGHIPDS